jgi:tricorn protease
MRLTSTLRLAVVLLLSLVLDRFASAQNLPNTTRLLRFPTTNGSQIVFCYAGELYTVAKEGGIARRLTSGPGYTSFPRFSPD